MSNIIPPMDFEWDGDRFIPRHPRRADQHFVVGEMYRLGIIEERSVNSHNHYFASVHDAWMNLPEHLAMQFPTDTHLRKFALIKAGYYDSRSIVCASKVEAQRVASFIKPMDEFAVVTVSEAVVTVYTAKSQSYRAMGRKLFQQSKTDVLDVIAAMVGVKTETLRENAGAAA